MTLIHVVEINYYTNNNVNNNSNDYYYYKKEHVHSGQSIIYNRLKKMYILSLFPHGVLSHGFPFEVIYSNSTPWCPLSIIWKKTKYITGFKNK